MSSDQGAGRRPAARTGAGALSASGPAVADSHPGLGATSPPGPSADDAWGLSADDAAAPAVAGALGVAGDTSGLMSAGALGSVADDTSRPLAEPAPARPSTPPDRVARAALARAQEAARTRGLRPGDKPRRSSAAPVATAAGPDARDPQPIGATAGRLATELGWRPGLVEGDLRGRWPELVGPDIAEHCRPETFDAGLLTLRASSTAWATTLTLEAQRLLGRLAEELGEGVVVEVKVLGPAGPGFGRGRRSVPGRGARDTWG